MTSFDGQRARPFIKWAGGKGQVLKELRRHYPNGAHIRKYAEPFVGGGAVLFDVLSRFSFDEVYINDSNEALIHTYRMVRDDAEGLIELLKRFSGEYLKRSDAERRAYYYEKRARYNACIRAGALDTESAALFLFLNRTCFNGLYRVNRDGAFNVPAGRYKNPVICDADNLRRASKALQGVVIRCGDYTDADLFIDGNTFVYFDPPYRPLTKTAGFTAYTEEPFDDEAQKRLAAFVHRQADKGAHVLASNSDPRNADPQDSFFDELYAPLHIRRIFASRMINSKGSARGKISELIICSDAELSADDDALPEDAGLVWEKLSEKHLIQNEWIDFRESSYRLPDGTVFSPYYSYSRRSYVVIVPQDEEGKFLCVRQFRHGIEKVTTEFPAGGIEGRGKRQYALDAAEDALQSARRELSEETGYTSEDWTHLITIPSNATVADNDAHIFLARNCRKQGGLHTDATEFLRVVRVNAEEIEEMIAAGRFQQAMHVMAWLLALRQL